MNQKLARKLTTIEKRVLAILGKGPARPSDIGFDLWYGVRTKGGGSSNPFTRPAGRVLRRLERMGLVSKSHDNYWKLGK